MQQKIVSFFRQQSDFIRNGELLHETDFDAELGCYLDDGWAVRQLSTAMTAYVPAGCSEPTPALVVTVLLEKP